MSQSRRHFLRCKPNEPVQSGESVWSTTCWWLKLLDQLEALWLLLHKITTPIGFIVDSYFTKNGIKDTNETITSIKFLRGPSWNCTVRVAIQGVNCFALHELSINWILQIQVTQKNSEIIFACFSKTYFHLEMLPHPKSAPWTVSTIRCIVRWFCATGR